MPTRREFLRCIGLAMAAAACACRAEPTPTNIIEEKTTLSPEDMPQPLLPVVEVEEEIYSYEPANNGATPLWCYGSSCIARLGERVLVSGLETLKEAPLPNNVRWLLYVRGPAGWELVRRDESGRTREPCPIGVCRDGRVFLSVNPTLAQLNQKWGHPAQPQVLQFSADDLQAPPVTLLPAWLGAPAFTEHSYRGLAVDGPRGELLLLNILGHQAQYWSFLDREGRWSAKGALVFPVAPEFGERLRLCYPEVALRDRAAHVFAVSDIVEPIKEWKEYKFALTQSDWDYVFRRIFYTWTPDIVTTPFIPWLELGNQEKYAGHFHNLDLWIAPDGAAHLLWIERTLDPRLRSRFFPDAVLTVSLVRAVLRDGQLVRRDVLLEGGEGAGDEIPLWGRLHATPQGRLFCFYCARKGSAGARNYLLEVLPDGRRGEPVPVPLAKPLTNFMTATERNGSPPSDTLDLYGSHEDEHVMRYVRIKLKPERSDHP